MSTVSTGKADMTATDKAPEFGSAEWFAAAQAALDGLDTGDAVLVLEHQILANEASSNTGSEAGPSTDSSTGTSADSDNASEVRGDLRYRLIIAAGKATIQSETTEPAGLSDSSDSTPPSPTPAADVVLIQPASVAAKIRSGQLGALTAIQSGQIEIKGDVTKLLAATDAVAAVDEALSNLSH